MPHIIIIHQHGYARHPSWCLDIWHLLGRGEEVETMRTQCPHIFNAISP
ncbi:MAG: hypothetical protein R6V46_09655 [Desulfatiglandaceae bacterium]